MPAVSEGVRRGEPSNTSFESEGVLRIPGFIDLQINGYRGVDFSDPSLTLADCVACCEAVLHHTGTVAFLPTVITSPLSTYEKVLPVLADAAQHPTLQGRLLGVHLEGPFISASDGARGCHPKEHVRAPDVSLLMELQRLANGTVRLLTLAPEVPGAIDLIAAASAAGIVVSCGHHLGTSEDLKAAADAGASLLTHLGNGVPRVLDRHSNPIIAGLAEERLMASIIADGFHLPAPMLKVLLHVKAAASSILVSDMVHLAGQPPGIYNFGDGKVVLEPNGFVHQYDGPYLAGSSCSMLQCVNHVARLQLLGLRDLEEVAFFNPLRVLGISPDVALKFPVAVRVCSGGGFELHA